MKLRRQKSQRLAANRARAAIDTLYQVSDSNRTLATPRNRSFNPSIDVLTRAPVCNKRARSPSTTISPPVRRLNLPDEIRLPNRDYSDDSAAADEVNVVDIGVAQDAPDEPAVASTDAVEIPALIDARSAAGTGSLNRAAAAGRRQAFHHRILEHRIARTYRASFNPTPVKGESFCDCPKQDRDLDCACGEEDAVLEWLWDPRFKSSAADVAENPQKARFHVNYSSGTASIRGTQLMSDRQYFWEVKMTSPVYGTDMMVGVGTSSVDFDSHRHTFTSMLGSDGESWGLSYYGRIQHRDHFTPYDKSQFGQGSIIGVHLDMWHGELSFYKNRRPLGVAFRGLAGKKLYPMVSSTAARTSMKVINATSFKTSLQFLCCQRLRQLVPTHLTIGDVFSLPPGLRAFLNNNLLWLLRPVQTGDAAPVTTTMRRRRTRSEAGVDDGASSSAAGAPAAKWPRHHTGIGDSSEDSDVELT